jgi:DNA gyrase/topoisomerase IV subunit A
MTMFEELELADYATRAMMLYGVNVNVQRAIPFIADGLKPLQRRILYGIYKKYGKDRVTVASSVGDTIHYSPHGDITMKDSYALLAQPFSNNVPLLKAKGNCGTPAAGKDAAAARYWAVSISPFALDVLFDEFDGKVNMRPNYDNTDKEPITLPAKFPVILLNGSNGIGYTLSSDCLPYNLNDIADATIKLIKNPKAKVKLIPDSPTGCDIIVRDDTTFVMQSSFEIDNLNYTITFKNTPFGEYIVNVDDALRTIQLGPDPIKEIISANEESSDVDFAANRISYVVRCRPGNMYKIVDKLFRRVSGLRITVSTNNVNVVDPNLRIRKLQPDQILLEWIENRKTEKRAYYLRALVVKSTLKNMLQGKIIMLSPENLNKTIKIFRTCETDAEIIDALVEGYKKEKITTSQAHFISELKLSRLTHGEYVKTVEKLKEVESEIEELKSIVEDPEKVKDKIIDEIKTIKEKYGNSRRSKILNKIADDNVSLKIVQILSDGSVMFNDTENPEHLSSDITTVNEDSVCLIDEFGQFVWIDMNRIDANKQFTLTSIGKTQMGKCVAALSNPDHTFIMLTNQGRIKYMPVNKIPSNASRKPLLPLNEDEHIVSILDIGDTSRDLLVYTSDGYGKRFSISDLNKVSSVDGQGQFILTGYDVAGIFAINPNKPYLVYVTRLGRIRLNHTKFLGSGTKFGNIKPIIKLTPQDDLIAVFCAEHDQDVTMYHADGRVSTVKLSSLEVSTMSAPPIKPKHVPGIKLIRATLS